VHAVGGIALKYPRGQAQGVLCLSRPASAFFWATRTKGLPHVTPTGPWHTSRRPVKGPRHQGWGTRKRFPSQTHAVSPWLSLPSGSKGDLPCRRTAGALRYGRDPADWLSMGVAGVYLPLDWRPLSITAAAMHLARRPLGFMWRSGIRSLHDFSISLVGRSWALSSCNFRQPAMQALGL